MYPEDERIQEMKVLNVMMELELQRMKSFETIKDYSNKLLSIDNEDQLLGNTFCDYRTVEKSLVIVLEQYEVSIAALENTKGFIQNHFGQTIACLSSPRDVKVYVARFCG